MLRRILLAIDDTPSSHAARALAIDLSVRHQAQVTGAAVIDTPWITRPEPVPIGGSAIKIAREVAQLREAHERVQAEIRQFRHDAARAATAFAVLEGEGSPSEVLTTNATAHDLIVVGHEATFHFGAVGNSEPAAPSLVRNNHRPVLIVPAGKPSLERTIVAFDGSGPSSRALHMFALLGLAGDREVLVLTVDTDQSAAQQTAAEAVRLLSAHGADAVPLGIGSDARPADIILAESKAWGAAMIVMSAFGHSGWQELFYGSCTRRLMRACPAALFIHH